ncbi:unnamed protein product [Soboliphyme baturini]|uniref:Squamous cell carcinoma antigen recognized by T-cells 3 n=1 Tax=Soboliphyme baturini TaxID=241478 RepID=A0A183IH00_9BILA|nr:unnamed protein product [Soboliphyme baturini]
MNSESSDDSAHSIEEIDLDALETKVKQNPSNYQAHLELVNACRRSGEFDRLKTARHNMQAVYPLSAELWLEWTKDEQKIGTGVSELKKLFDLAVQDYLSVELWLEYALWGCSHFSIDEARAVFERAVQAAGLHVAEGLLIWEAYRQFELSLLEELSPVKADSDKDNEPKQQDDYPKQTLFDEQRERFRRVFVRQLCLPLMDMEQGMKDYTETFGAEAVDSSLDYNYKSALKVLAQLKPFESQLKEAGKKTADVYSKYLDLEETLKNPARLQCLFERAVADHCLDGALWLRYVRWLDNELKDSNVSLSVYERAVRNCPWTTVLWQEYAMSCERFGLLWEQIEKVMKCALEAGFSSVSEAAELWLQYAYQCRRRQGMSGNEVTAEVQKIFCEGAAFLKEKFGGDCWDPEFYYRKCWARFEARHNIELFRELWDSILKEGNCRFANVWLEYIALERQFGNTQSARRLYQKAANSVSDFPEALFQCWIQFEREEGTLQDLDFARKKVEHYMERLHQRQAQTNARANKSNRRMQREGRNSDRTATIDAHNGSERRDSRKSINASKNRRLVSSDKAAVPLGGIPDTMDTSQRTKRDGDGFVIPILPKKLKTTEVKPTPNKERLMEVFETVGEVSDIRLVMLRPGRSKGYCYVEFKEGRCVDEALKLDRHMIDGRPMFVSVCKGDPQRSEVSSDASSTSFKYGTGEEKNKLFVKNVPKSATEYQLEELFKVYGKLRSVRLVTYKSGASKGLAYIEYEDVESATKALEKTDGTYFHGKQLMVSISNPPPRRSEGEDGGIRFAKILKQAHVSIGGREARSRQRVQLLPRSILLSLRFWNFLFAYSLPPINVYNHACIELFNRIDDIEDNSVLRRGMPVTHKIYGVPLTINSANYVYFLALQETMRLNHPKAVEIFTEQLLALHRGQALDIYWRDTVSCPTEEQYTEMVLQKTGGLFFLAIKLMQLFSDNKQNYSQLLTALSIYFQIRDDYCNLQAPDYFEKKSFAEDLTEGKFSFPIIHAVRTFSDDDRIISKIFCIKAVIFTAFIS